MKSGEEPGRRHHDRAFKAKLVELSMQPGASASTIAREHGINANLLFTWRREHRDAAVESSGVSQAAVLLPVRLARPATEECTASTVQMLPAPATAPTTNRASRPGVIELEVAGAHLRLTPAWRGGRSELV